MVKPTFSSLRLGFLTALLIAAMSLQAHALDITARSLNCTMLTWTAVLSQAEWNSASNIQLSLTSTQGQRNYSLLYSASSVGDFPRPGTYNMITPFGNIDLEGGYRVGIALADGEGAPLTAATGSPSSVQWSDFDPRVFIFDDCSSSSSGTVVVSTAAASSSTSPASSTTTSVSTTATSTSASATQSRTATSATSLVTSSTVPAASTSSSAAAAAGTLSSATTATLPNSSSMNKGAIAGAVVGGLVLLGILFALVRWCSSRQRTRKVSRSVHRLSPLRPLSLTEKFDLDAPRSPTSPHRFSSKFYASGETFEVGTLGRYSVSSQRKSEGYSRSASRADNQSLRNVAVRGSSSDAGDEEIRIVKVPFHLFPTPPAKGVTRGSPTHSLSRTSSTPEEIPVYPTEHPGDATHGRSKSIPLPLPLQLPSINTSPLTSPTRSVRPSPSTSAFRIPRVSVPSYHNDDNDEPTDTRRYSTGGATFVSVDEDPFVDAAQEPLPEGARERTLV